MTSIDLKPTEITLVKSILHQFLNRYDVWAFGSRVTHTAKKFSDLDLVVLGEKAVPFSLLVDVNDAFRESDLPFKVDIVNWSTTSEPFKNIIKKNYIVLQSKQ